MFDTLSEKLQATLGDLRGRGRLDEEAVSKAMREIRLALLEADVNFKVVREFTARLKERCMGAEVLGGLNPGQQVVKIVAEQLTELMGGVGAEMGFSPSARMALGRSPNPGGGRYIGSRNDGSAGESLDAYLKEKPDRLDS